MDVSETQVDKSRRTIRAAQVFADNAQRIAEHVLTLPSEHVVVAVVSGEYEFSGIHHVPRTELVERVPALEGEGWAMVFSPGANDRHIASRTAEMAALAAKRIEMLERIAARRQTAE